MIMAKVTGIGGVFFKAKDTQSLSAWYQKHLGLKLEDFGGAILKWPDDQASDDGLTVWSLSKEDSDWFTPSQSSFMINYRIDDMAGMIRQLNAEGIEIWKGPETHENGQFAWIIDPEGNKVELWEPKAWGE